MNKKLILSLITITLLVTSSFLGCSSKETVKPSETVSTNIENKLGSANTQTSKDNTIVVTSEQALLFKYIATDISSDSIIELNTPWEESPLKTFKVTIEGKGEKVEEEGYSHIILKDEKTNKLTKLTLEDEKKNKLTAKDLEWIDENNMLVILGQPFGTISKGGKIYKVNIKSGEIFLFEDTAGLREEFTSIHKSGNNFNFEKFIYDDENFINGHIVSGSIQLK